MTCFRDSARRALLVIVCILSVLCILIPSSVVATGLAIIVRVERSAHCTMELGNDVLYLFGIDRLAGGNPRYGSATTGGSSIGYDSGGNRLQIARWTGRWTGR